MHPNCSDSDDRHQSLDANFDAAPFETHRDSSGHMKLDKSSKRSVNHASSRGSRSSKRRKENVTSSTDTVEIVLSDNIRVSKALKSRLTQQSIHDLNIVVQTLARDDPGLVLQIDDVDRLHAALLLPGSPIPPGANPTQSVHDFLNWAIDSANLADGVGNANYVGVAAWHHLSEDQANEIVYQHWHILQWAMSIQHAAYPGPVVTVLWMTGTGPGRAHMFAARQVFG